MAVTRNVSKQELKKSKEVTTLLLEAQGINYDDWLHEKHKEIENDSQEVIEQALELFINQKGKEQGKEPFFNATSNND